MQQLRKAGAMSGQTHLPTPVSTPLQMSVSVRRHSDWMPEQRRRPRLALRAFEAHGKSWRHSGYPACSAGARKPRTPDRSRRRAEALLHTANRSSSVLSVGTPSQRSCR